MSRMGERARLLESQARCGVQRRRATTSPTTLDTTKYRIRTPRYPSLSLSTLPSSKTPYHSHNPSQIPMNAFRRNLIKKWWSVHTDPVPMVSITHPGSHWHSRASQTVFILQSIICLGWPFVLTMFATVAFILSLCLLPYGVWDGSGWDITMHSRCLPLLYLSR